MPVSNVNECYYYRVKAGGTVMDLAEVRAALARPTIRLRGVNFYYGINNENVTRFADSGIALHPFHQDFFQRTVDDLLKYSFDQMTVVLAVQPPKFLDRFKNPEPHANDPFEHVMSQTALLKALATELLPYKKQAADAGKTLRIIIRYASEMNDIRIDSQGKKHNAWGQQPVLYKSSFGVVRATMRAVDPDLLFAFSPAIRRDLHPKKRPDVFTIDKYYPGETQVDIVSGTWYVGTRMSDLDWSADLLSRHMLEYKHDDVLFGLDEVGGYDAGDEGNALGPCDPTLKAMMSTIKALGGLGVHFDYLTFFMQNGEKKPWSRARLTFV